MQTKKQVAKSSSVIGSCARTSFRVHSISFIAGTSLIAFLIFAYYISIWQSFGNFQAAISTCSEPFCDFADYYYPMGVSILRTGLPVEGFVYSPFIAILLVIFPLLGFKISLVLWGVLQAIAIIVYLLLFRQLVLASLPINLLFVALTLSSFPLLHTLTWGQVSIFITVAILGALVLYERGQHIAAAALLAFAVSFKFFPIIFLAPFIFRRDTRFLFFGTVACGVFLFVVPSILLGIGETLNFFSVLLDTFRNFDWVITNHGSQYFPHVVLRLMKAIGFNPYAYLPLLRGIAYSTAAVNVGLVYLVQRARLPHANLWSFHILFLSIPFVLMTSWPVDLVYIPFAQTLLAWQLMQGKNDEAQGKRLLLMRAVVMLLLLTSIIVSNIILFNLISGRFGYEYYGFIFWANLLLLAASYVEILPPVCEKIRKKGW